MIILYGAGLVTDSKTRKKLFRFKDGEYLLDESKFNDDIVRRLKRAFKHKEYVEEDSCQSSLLDVIEESKPKKRRNK